MKIWHAYMHAYLYAHLYTIVLRKSKIMHCWILIAL